MPDDAITFLRNQAFAEVARLAARVESYARSLEEATWRGDAVTTGAHLRQVRLCCIAMIQTYKDYLDGENVGGAAQAQSSHRNRQDQRPGDGVA